MCAPFQYRISLYPNLDQVHILFPVLGTRINNMRVSVIGCGYLGAVHAATMTKLGHVVTATDVDADRIKFLSDGKTPFFEPGFDEILDESLASNRLRFTTNLTELADSEVHFITVGTPQSKNSQAADLSYVRAAVRSIAPHLAEGALLVGKSTVPVGTASDLADFLAEQAPQAMLAWNPEFLREGFAVEDSLRPDRLVYGVPEGAPGNRAVDRLDEVYMKLLSHGVPRIVTNYATAELVKVAANAFLATKISFINAMGEISELMGADVSQLADAMGLDARIGRKFLNAGIGFGGGCLPKDIRAFAAHAESLGAGDSIAFLHEVEAINLRQRTRTISHSIAALGGSVEGRRITVLGASFKPDSEDVRESPALEIASKLSRLGAQVTVTDPKAIQNAKQKHPELYFEIHLEDALKNAELVLLLTEWREFRELNPLKVKSLVHDSGESPIIIDGRNCLDPEAWQSAGWQYQGLGR